MSKKGTMVLSVIAGIIVLGAGIYGLVKTNFPEKAFRVFTVASVATPGTEQIAGKGNMKGAGQGNHGGSGGSSPPSSIVKLDQVGLWFLVFAFFVCVTAWVIKAVDILTSRKKNKPR
jgi:hypothetical protein